MGEARMFRLNRVVDETGVSGTGIVAEGIEFSSGKCALAWRTDFQSVAVYDSIADVKAIHGHDGRTHIQWHNADGSWEGV